MSGSHGGVTATGSDTPPRRHDDVSEEQVIIQCTLRFLYPGQSSPLGFCY
jgi:hypothetical protein